MGMVRMSTRLRNRFGSVFASAALSGALVLCLTGTAAAEPSTDAALSAAPPAVALTGGAVTSGALASSTLTSGVLTERDRGRRCHREWHPGRWFWRDEGNWDRHHHWFHGRGHHWQNGWWSGSCR